MSLRYYANAPATTLANSCTSGATSIAVTSTTGLPITYPYTLIIDRGEATEEVVEVTNASGTTLTITRGVDDTTGFAHATGASVVHGFSARDLREPNAHINSTDDVHGVTSDVVGVDDAQTFNNKTIPVPDNIINGLPVSSFAYSTGTGTLANAANGVKAIPTGTVVGTTDTQTLTNKTLATASNTFDAGVLNPTGTIAMFGSSTPPTGWLMCDGSAVSRATYSALFAVIGTSFGVGDGSTTFNLPNFTGVFPRGNGTVGTTGGSTTITEANLPAHTHGSGTLATASDGAHRHDLDRSSSTGASNNNIPTGTNTTANTGNAPLVSNGAHTHNITGSTGSTGSGTAYFQPFVRVAFIIKW